MSTSTKNHGRYLLDRLKVSVPCQQRGADLHATGCNPNIVNRNFCASLLQREIDDPIFSGHIRIHRNNVNFQPGNELLQFFLHLFFVYPLCQ